VINQEIDRYKKVVLMALLKLTIVAGFIFSYINFQRGLFLFTSFQVFIISITIGIYFKVRTTFSQQVIESASLAYTLIFLSAMMVAFVSEGISNSMFVWAFTIPMISYLLLGIQKGFIVTIIYYTLSTIFLFRKYNLQEIDHITYANIFIAAIGFWGLSHVYEKANFLTKQKLNKMAIYDKLTGLHNRTMLSQIFAKIVSQAQLEKQQVSFIAFDLDLFKDINDQFGHVAGDEVLKKFSKMLSQNLPKNASAFRLGGEEFAVIYPCDSLIQAKDLAESLRLKAENISIMFDEITVKITVSAGVAINNPEDINLTNMLKVSDKRLYQAKRGGRNRIVYNDNV
jgi:diguanylate cyclase (GGDEF)-like protein